LETPNKHY
jgi:serine/threonine protein phosphatase PrpC